VTVRLVLVRHGRVDFDALDPDDDFLVTPRGRQWNPPLDAHGREQAERLAARLRLMDPPATILLSPFRRCRETLAPYLDGGPGLTPTLDPDVGEVFVGAWEGVRFEDIVAGDEELARRFRDQEPMFALAPGGETGEQLRARVVPAVERALSGVDDGTVLVVTHGGVINAYLGHVMGVPHDMFFLPDNGSMNSVRVDGSSRDVLFLNDVRHLTDPAIFAPPAGVGEHSRDLP